MERRFHTGGKVDQTRHGAVGNVDAGLRPWSLVSLVPSLSHRKLLGVDKENSHLVVAGIGDVLFVVHVHRVGGSAVDDVGNALAADHDSVVVAVIVADEDSSAVFVVRGDEASCGTQVVGRELGYWSCVCIGHGDEFEQRQWSFRRALESYCSEGKMIRSEPSGSMLTISSFSYFIKHLRIDPRTPDIPPFAPFHHHTIMSASAKSLPRRQAKLHPSRSWLEDC